jgi:hypothetical protein
VAGQGYYWLLNNKINFTLADTIARKMETGHYPKILQKQRSEQHVRGNAFMSLASQ